TQQDAGKSAMYATAPVRRLPHQMNRSARMAMLLVCHMETGSVPEAATVADDEPAGVSLISMVASREASSVTEPSSARYTSASSPWSSGEPPVGLSAARYWDTRTGIPSSVPPVAVMPGNAGLPIASRVKARKRATAGVV